MLDDTAAKSILAIESGDYILRTAQHLHTPYKTAVYVWTQGGYQVGREPDNYPLFLAVGEQDVDAWETFFESFDPPTAFEGQPQDELDRPLQIVLEPRSSLDIEHVERYPVIPRTETIEYIRENYAQFQSGLAMFAWMYSDVEGGRE